MTTRADDRHRAPTRAAVHIVVLHVPNCSKLNNVRMRIDRAMTATGIRATIEEVVGDYPSPTVLVNGVDVTGRPIESGAACRLDLPTDEQLSDALIAAASRVGSPA
jgi:hypothetical protein